MTSSSSAESGGDPDAFDHGRTTAILVLDRTHHHVGEQPTWGSPVSDRVTFDRAGALAVFRACIPIALGVVTYGVVFGVLARQAGLSMLETGLMSAVVFAGFAQFVAIELWQTPLPSLTLILTTLVVNLRHILMGAALRSWFSNLGPAETYGSAFFMTDENWALMMGELADGSTNAAFLLGNGLALFFAWIGSTVTGAAVGGLVTNVARYGLDFAFIAVFITLLVGLWDGRSDLVPWLSAALVAVVASQVLPGSWYILLGGIAGSLVAVVSSNGE